jgi:hypothetical protein
MSYENHHGLFPRTLNALLKQALQENLILRTADGHEFLLAKRGVDAIAG